jgi:hypothetical protein
MRYPWTPQQTPGEGASEAITPDVQRFLQDSRQRMEHAQGRTPLEAEMDFNDYVLQCMSLTPEQRRRVDEQLALIHNEMITRCFRNDHSL